MAARRAHIAVVSFLITAGALVVAQGQQQAPPPPPQTTFRGSVEISPGDQFVVGEQVFRLDPTPKASDGADPDGTFFYSSPKYPSAFRLNQILEGGAIGMTICARGNSLQVGREDGDLNFPGDMFMSAKHATVEEKEGKFVLTDFDSRNGTYLRLKTERALSHGDYVFIGKKLLRVELNAN